MFCLPCWYPFRKPDDGIMVLEDLSRPSSLGGNKYENVDKSKVLGVEHARCQVLILNKYFCYFIF